MSVCADCGIELRDGQCRAHRTRDRAHCGKQAIKGATVCRHHGGSAGQVRAAAERRLALDEARGKILALGIEVDTTPEEAIFAMIREAAGNVALLRAQVAALEATVGPDGIAGRTGNEKVRHEAKPHVLVVMYDEERDRLVRYAKVAAEIGLSERMVTLAEQQGQLIAQIFTAALDDPEWGLDRGQKEAGKRVIGRHLSLVHST